MRPLPALVPGTHPHQGARESNLKGGNRQNSPSRALPGNMRISYRSPTPVQELVSFHPDVPASELMALSNRISDRPGLQLAPTASAPKPPWKLQRKSEKKTSGLSGKWLPGSLHKDHLVNPWQMGKGRGRRKGGGKGKGNSKGQKNGKK